MAVVVFATVKWIIKSYFPDFFYRTEFLDTWLAVRILH